MPKQTKLFLWNNQNLFSNNYLEHHLPTTSLWKEQKEKITDVFDDIKKAYSETKTLTLGSGEEAGLEDKFIRPVLKALGFEWDVQPIIKRGIKKKRPDYALFKDKASIENARKEKDNLTRFFKYPVTILEAKYWDRQLNDTDPKDTLDKRDPTAQTVKYLDDVYHVSESRIQWAILTNGKNWRLFYYKAASRSGNFFEIDIEDIITKNDTEKFLYFYLFFSKNAFIPDTVTGRTWLDQHLKGTEEYAVRVSETLKNLIFDEIFEGLAAGFIEYRRNELKIYTETNESLGDVFAGCLTLLYRLLFLLYAESRNLLPSDDQSPYYRKSLRKLKEDIYKDITTTGIEHLSHNAYDYWSRFESLCRIIDKGDKALNIPIYNGGLFETHEDSFLSRHKISDPFFAKAIEKLTVDHEVEHSVDSPAFIDYSSLSVRHLGDIYEGLLEFHVQIANEEMIEVKEKGKSLWKKGSEAKKDDKIISRKQSGEIYIENSKHERKATGSYYTPHYIVEYIVKNTVGTVLDEKLKAAESLFAELENANKALHKQSATNSIQGYKAKIREIEDKIFDSIFGISVLDPAMGSGHFLVHTVDFISDKIIAFLTDYPENSVLNKIAELKKEILEEINRQGVKIDESKLTEVNLIKRMVMKRCIYGVDLNEMAVELAKLSLWLDSFTLGAPLSFLDHHLKCGNSLIGTTIEELEKALTGHLFAINLEPLKRAIRDMIFVSDLPDATVEQVRESYKKFGEANKGLEGYKILLDMLIVGYFGIADAKKMLVSDFDKIDLNNLYSSISKLQDKDRKLIKNTKVIAKEKKFFHWEIEFPEVFYERTTEFGQKINKKENSGFNCVIGNPPYDVLSELEQGKEIEADKKFFEHQPIYVASIGNKLNLYRLFSGLSLNLLKNKGAHGFIVPMTLLADKQAKPLREFMLKNNYIKAIEAFPQKDDPANRIFVDAKLSTCIYILNKQEISLFRLRIHTGKEIDESSTVLELNPSLINEFDRENLSIPSYPDITTKDFMLALKLNKVSKDIKLKQFAQSQQGEVNLTEHSDFFTNKNQGQIILRGAHVNRYEFQKEPKQGEPVYLNVNKFLNAHDKDTKAYDSRYIRIGYQRGSAIDNWRRIIATIIEKDNFCSDTINYIVKPKEYELFAILALLNSFLWEWRFRLTSTNNHVNSYEIDSMPVPSISFTTLEKKRNEFFKEVVKQYELSKYDDVVKWAEHELVLKRNDTVHDFLTYLAKQMIELNKSKNEEIEGFLKWFEREIRTEIDTLTNRTAIKEYHDHDFNNLIDVLKKNKNKISLDPSARKTQELLEKHFTKSVSVLHPLKERIKATDNLIDQIVYKLYGLTDEEIEIVEGKSE